MKIAVLGSNGFVGSNLVKILSAKYETVGINRQKLNLLDLKAVTSYLEENNFYAVINAAAIMTDQNTIDDTRNNLGIFMNFYHNSNLFKKFINLASGAEYDRTMNIDCINEVEIFNRLPKDSYGFGQNIKSRLCWDKTNFFNIRIFNCFGIGEYPTRIFTRFLNQKEIEIVNDRYFDYFSINDLSIVVDNCITNDWPIKDVNAVYNEKFKISQVLEKFCYINELDPKIKIISDSNNNYTGNGKNLKDLKINLTGLDKGLAVYTQKG